MYVCRLKIYFENEYELIQYRFSIHVFMTVLNFESRGSNKETYLLDKHTLATVLIIKLSRIVRKPDYCLCENKGADQLRSNCEADQRLCFRYSDSTIPLLLKSEISSF